MRLREAQQQLILSEKMASLGTMVAGIAHEINTPLAVIKGALDNSIDNLANILKSMKSILNQDLDKNQLESLFEFFTILETFTGKMVLDTQTRFKLKNELMKKFKNLYAAKILKSNRFF